MALRVGQPLGSASISSVARYAVVNPLVHRRRELLLRCCRRLVLRAHSSLCRAGTNGYPVRIDRCSTTTEGHARGRSVLCDWGERHGVGGVPALRAEVAVATPDVLFVVDGVCSSGFGVRVSLRPSGTHRTDRGALCAVTLERQRQVGHSV